MVEDNALLKSSQGGALTDVHLYFNRDFFIGPNDAEMLSRLETCPRKIIICRSWSDLGKLMKLAPKSICIQATESNFTSAVEIVNMIKTLAKLVEVDDNISISIAVELTTTYESIKEFQKSDIHSLIPFYRDFGLDEAMKGLDAQWHGIPYWPKHIIDQLPGSKSNKAQTLIKDIKLTPRQTQILNLVLERGSSNKIIARTLNISESTVKLHLGHIFKKYGVKNRTQLAVFAKK